MLVTFRRIGFFLPGSSVGRIILITVPGTLSIWTISGFGLSHYLTSLESAFVVLEPVLITFWVGGLSFPSALVHSVSLIVVPSSESIWIIAPLAMRVFILFWIGSNLHKLLASLLGSLVLLKPVLIALRVFSLGFPSSTISRVILV